MIAVPRCDWCGVCVGEMILVAESVDGAPAYACRACWDSPALGLLRTVVTAREELRAGAPGAAVRAEALADAVRRALNRRSIPLAPRALTAGSVRVGDGIAIGGETFLVVRRTVVAGGVKLRFAGGELLALHGHTPLTVMRPGDPW